ncbi:hypothetical protein [Actinokineospora iranica]|uniref:HTH cro/C1-type domain-containing protein n=1 Tax=Actinokineospora iranica TaxID=1271860 RepID=A0A1G6P2Y8_9PSEU|nr:hypothetical protein [Actinokineospora iranica]SDC73964.1 hypothetical protein SAMN05216174_10469 [Actinokineospora iranica]
MPRKAGASGKAERDQLRDRMRALGCSVAQIAAEMSRRFNLRPRAAWRHALGWPQWKLAQEYNTAHPGAKLADNRISEYESWPHGGTAPSVRYLSNLAATFGHGCTPAHLVDVDDMEHLSPTDRRLLAPAGDALMVSSANIAPFPETHPDLRLASRNINTVGSRGNRRVVRRDARGLPIREEVVMAAEESAQFRRWSATTNVDDEVLEQMAADIAEVASSYLTDPPATVFSRLIGARDDVFALIAGRQHPRHSMELYKIGGQMCALLAHASADLGHPHAANTHARTALHCAEVASYTPLRVYTRWVQSNVAYWDGRYDDAAGLVEAALPDATSGTALLRLTSQQARINAARQDSAGVVRALAAASAAPTDPTADEPGVFAFATGKAAYYASEAHRELGGDKHLDAAIDWALTAVNEFAAERHPNAQFVAAARIDLTRAHLARGDLDAVGEHLAPVLSTVAEQRTVPVISRVRSLTTLLSGHPGIESSTVASLRDDLAEFCSTPAASPSELNSAD